MVDFLHEVRKRIDNMNLAELGSKETKLLTEHTLKHLYLFLQTHGIEELEFLLDKDSLQKLSDDADELCMSLRTEYTWVNPKYRHSSPVKNTVWT